MGRRTGTHPAETSSSCKRINGRNEPAACTGFAIGNGKWESIRRNVAVGRKYQCSLYGISAEKKETVLPPAFEDRKQNQRGRKKML